MLTIKPGERRTGTYSLTRYPSNRTVEEKLNSTRDSRAELRPLRWKLFPVGDQQLEEWRDFIEAWPPSNRLRIGVPSDEIRLLELREVDVTQPRRVIFASFVAYNGRRNDFGLVARVRVEE